MDRDRQIAELESELEVLRERLHRLAPPGPGDAPVSRRRLLGLTGAGVVGAAIFATARPAGAGVDGDLVLDTDNVIGATTSVSMLADGGTAFVVAHKNAASTSPAFATHHEGMGVAVDAGLTNASNDSAAIAADTAGTGVAVDATAPSGAAAIRGSSTSGFGVQGVSADAIGVKGASTSATGVDGSSVGGDGVVGVQASADEGVAATKAGVRGISSKGPAVIGESPKVGVQGASPAGIGVEGLAVPGGIGVAGKGSAVGVVGVSRFVDVGAALDTSGGNLVGSVTGVADTGTGVVGRSGVGTGVHADGNIGITTTGTRSPLMLIPADGAGPPTTRSHSLGQFWADKDGNIYVCTSAGTPGKWSKLNDQVRDPSGLGDLTAGPTFLATPQRAFDSRPGRTPTGEDPATKGAFTGGETRVVDLGAATDVPASATAVSINLTVTNTERSGYVSVYSAAAATIARPSFSSINWSASGQNIANAIDVACDGSQRIKVYSSGDVDVIVDVLGSYA